MGRQTFPDVRGLVPRTPPEGLIRWVLGQDGSGALRGGLLYETEMVTACGIAAILDESERRKIKMVRVTCSQCGGSALLHWGYDRRHGYGFILPDELEGDWGHSVTAHEDTCPCPICGDEAVALKRSAVRGPRVTGQVCAMSADVVGDERYLVLTGWIIENRVYKSGYESLESIPAEAYVFGRSGCAQLLGWVNAYGGNTGYRIQYTREWRQPRPPWRERWGKAETIYGLTPELIERSCLPHCKLDVYMENAPGVTHYPVAYLRLYQTHPNTEALLLHGLPRVLHDSIREQTGGDWPLENKMAEIDLPEIHWAEHRPAQMLGLTREELALGQRQGWGLLLWRLYARTKGQGERLTEGDMVEAFALGDENVLDLVGRGPVARSLRYLRGQLDQYPIEDEDEDPPAEGVPDVVTLLDYWDMCRALGRNLNDPAVRFPPNLLTAHDQAADLMRGKSTADMCPQFRVRRKILRRWSFMADGLLIRPAASQEELTAEGDALHHCVSTYGTRHATGRTAIFFIRRVRSPGTPYYTLELDEAGLTVRQNRGKYNCPRTPEVQEFEDKWLAWVRAGAPRDKNGRPVTTPKRKEQTA